MELYTGKVTGILSVRKKVATEISLVEIIRLKFNSFEVLLLVALSIVLEWLKSCVG